MPFLFFSHSIFPSLPANSGKFLNVGQTCVAPDYILVEKKVKDKLISVLKAKIRESFTDNPQQSPDYSRIINSRHTARIQGYLDEVRDNIILGGKADVQGRFLEPTLVDEPKPTSRLMQEEIFGPVLPIIGVDSVQEAARFVSARSKPLALYIFSGAQKNIDFVLENTSSGGVTVNGTLFHIICSDMPFGGVGPSGMGQYNGRSTFDTFTHQRAVLTQATFIDPPILYAPYSSTKKKIINFIADGVGLPRGFSWIIGALTVAATAAYAALF